MNIKKLLIILVLIAGITAIAFASLSNNRKSNKQAIEKKAEKKEKKCSRSCIFS